MKKVPGIADVRVSLKDGLTILDLKADNTVTLAQLRQSIKNNGFLSKDVTIVGRGTPASDTRTFTVSGTNEQLSISSAPRKAGDAWGFTVPAPGKQ
jgi:hypothetical protein